MTRPLRSNNGCWTCRLRRKKCDETRPICSLCESLVIPCYGYGPKPDWMDGGEIERKNLESFKQTVKHTSRRRGKATQHPLQKLRPNIVANSSTAIQQTAPLGECLDLPNAVSDDQDQVQSSASQHGTVDDAPELMQSLQLNESNVPNGERSLIHKTDSSDDIQGNNAKLLMHFLDCVFPLQFPMYKPATLQGDRGWFLSLLVEAKPLYHAVLGLSAYHQQTAMLQSTSQQRQHNVQNDSEKHHALCLRRLRAEIQALGAPPRDGFACPKPGLGVLTCILQLIFLEMFVNKTDSWQLHLNVVVDMAKGIHKLRRIRGLSESDLNAHVDVSVALELGWGLPQKGLYLQHPLVEEQVAVRFLTGVSIYLDIISCATMGTSPRLLEIHEDLIGLYSDDIHLENIIGCKNWVVQLIAKIAALRAIDPTILFKTPYVANECTKKSRDIKEALESGILSNAPIIAQLKCNDDYNFSAATSIRIITHVYAVAALIYLRIVTFGVYDDGEEVRADVASIIKVFDLAKYTPAAQSLTWPLYIAGSVAIGSERDYFRSLSPKGSPSVSMGSYQRTLVQLEEIWRNKDANAGTLTGGIFSSDLKCSTLLLM